MNHRQILSEGKNLLNKAEIVDGDYDAWVMFASSFSMSKTDYLMNSEKEADEGKAKEYFGKIARRIAKEPLQYIEGVAPFYGFEFKVTKDVLIPRFDTEILVEYALKNMPKGSKVLDMCTGSGCIAISVAILGNNSVTAVDISENALEIAQYNSKKNNAANVSFVKSDMFENISESYDYILSNPPYIPTADIMELAEEVKNGDPMLALDGHEDGLFFYRILAKEGYAHLNAGGAIIMEIGYNQAEDVGRLLEESNFKDIKVIKDLNGLDRVICGWRK